MAYSAIESKGTVSGMEMERGITLTGTFLNRLSRILCTEVDMEWIFADKIVTAKKHYRCDASVRSIDLDNAIKVTLDALKGVAFGDDKWVRELSAKRMEPDGDARMAVVVSRIQIVPPVG